MKTSVFDENYTFPIDIFTLDNFNDYNRNIDFFQIDKNIRYRIYNYINVDDNVSLSLASKLMYLEMREWFKMYCPPNDCEDITIYDKNYYGACYHCRSTNKKHVIFKTAFPWRLIDRNKLFYMCKSRKQTDKINGPIIHEYLMYEYAKNHVKFTDTFAKSSHKHKPYIYSFALYPEEYQPSGSANFSRMSETLATFSICWKCAYLIKIESTYKILNE